MLIWKANFSASASHYIPTCPGSVRVARLIEEVSRSSWTAFEPRITQTKYQIRNIIAHILIRYPMINLISIQAQMKLKYDTTKNRNVSQGHCTGKSTWVTRVPKQWASEWPDDCEQTYLPALEIIHETIYQSHFYGCYFINSDKMHVFWDFPRPSVTPLDRFTTTSVRSKE